MRGVAVMVRLPKVMGWLGGWEEFLPERDFRRDQNLDGLWWRFRDWTLLVQVSREWVAMASAMLLFRSGREGWLGLVERRASLSVTRGMAVGGRFGIKFLLQPLGMCRRAAERRVALKKASSREQD